MSNDNTPETGYPTETPTPDAQEEDRPKTYNPDAPEDGPERKKQITGEEYLLIAIVLLQNLRKSLIDPNTPNQITAGEWMQIVSAAGTTAWKEYND